MSDVPNIDDNLPVGYTFVRMGQGKKGELVVTESGRVRALSYDTHLRNSVIVRLKDVKAIRWQVSRTVQVMAVTQAEAARAAKKLMEETAGDLFYVYTSDAWMNGVDIDLTAYNIEKGDSE